MVDQAKAVEDASNEIAEAMGTLRSLDPAPLLDARPDRRSGANVTR